MGTQTEPARRFAYTPAEAAEALGISKTYAYQLIRGGRLYARRVGSRLLVPIAAIEAFLDGRAYDPKRNSS